MATRIELEFDNAADALVFIRLAELAEGVRIIDERSEKVKTQPKSQLPQHQTVTQPIIQEQPQSEQMKELDDMMPDWFK